MHYVLHVHVLTYTKECAYAHIFTTASKSRQRLVAIDVHNFHRFKPFPEMNADKRALHFLKRAMCSLKRAMYSLRRALQGSNAVNIRSRAAASSQCWQNSHILTQNSHVFTKKEPCIHSKEPCAHSKEPCVHSKEPYREAMPTTSAVDLRLLRNADKIAIHSLKRALSLLKRAIYSLQRAMYSLKRALQKSNTDNTRSRATASSQYTRKCLMRRNHSTSSQCVYTLNALSSRIHLKTLSYLQDTLFM